VKDEQGLDVHHTRRRKRYPIGGKEGKGMEVNKGRVMRVEGREDSVTS
jgi:hypothetical protein